jgi:hypothetical protein
MILPQFAIRPAIPNRMVSNLTKTGEESARLVMPLLPHHLAAACTDATLRPRREHRRTTCRISSSARSLDNRIARR